MTGIFFLPGTGATGCLKIGTGEMGGQMKCISMTGITSLSMSLGAIAILLRSFQCLGAKSGGRTRISC
jgi:hypothetical protein